MYGMFGATHFPVYRQLDQMDCGPACLKMITEYFGQSISLDYLRKISCLQKGGASLAALSNALSQLGIKSIGVKVNGHELVKEIPLPAIAHWEQSHFLVVYKTTKKYIHVSDPAIGSVKYLHNDFFKGWYHGNNEGILLLVEPHSDFYNETFEDKHLSGFQFIFDYLKPFKAQFNQIFLGLLIAAAIQFILPFLTQSIVDYGINYENIGFIYLIILAQLVLFITRSATQIFRDWILLHIGSSVMIEMITDYLKRILILPFSYFESKTTGDFIQRIYDHQRIKEFLSENSITILFDVITIISLAIVLAIFSGSIFLIFIVGTILFIGWSMLFMKKKESLDHRLFDISRKDQSFFLQIILSVLEIKLNNSEQRRTSEWRDNQSELYKVQSDTLKVDQAQINGSRFINELTNILIIFWSAKAVIQGEITLGTMLAIQFIVGSLNLPVANSMEFIVKFQRAKLSLRRLAEIHNQQSEVGNKKFHVLKEPEDIIIKNLSFSYNSFSDKPILRNISMVFPKGKVTAIVGSSGSGKTTLLKLLLKLYDPFKGGISIGAKNLMDIEPADWRRYCGAVLQDGVLFNDTIERNITESKSEEPIDYEKIKEVIKLANLSKFIEALPLTYSTKIGEQGMKLSGGEKQRILIARALYKNPEYLFFDEATSSLDSKNEKEITENLHTIYKNKTVIVIAHRLSTVKNADQIIVMNKGKIVERGTHEQLLALRGEYFELIQNQL